MSHLLGDASWIAYASSGLVLYLGSAKRCCRCHGSPNRRLEPMQVELNESDQSV